MTTTVVKFNKWIDLLDRGAWTGIQTFLGTIGGTSIVTGSLDWHVILISSGIATAAAIAKTMTAQNVGSSELGDAVPGKSIVEEKGKIG